MRNYKWFFLLYEAYLFSCKVAKIGPFWCFGSFWKYPFINRCCCILMILLAKDIILELFLVPYQKLYLTHPLGVSDFFSFIVSRATGDSGYPAFQMRINFIFSRGFFLAVLFFACFCTHDVGWTIFLYWIFRGVFRYLKCNVPVSLLTSTDGLKKNGKYTCTIL